MFQFINKQFWKCLLPFQMIEHLVSLKSYFCLLIPLFLSCLIWWFSKIFKYQSKTITDLDQQNNNIASIEISETITLTKLLSLWCSISWFSYMRLISFEIPTIKTIVFFIKFWNFYFQKTISKLIQKAIVSIVGISNLIYY